MDLKKAQVIIDVTPWYNKDEFLKVKDSLFSTNIKDAIWGLQRLEVWRQRSYPTLPVAVESTASIVRAKIEDELSEKGMCPLGDNKGLSLMFAAAVNEFVNNITELGQSNTMQINMKRAATNIGCPLWLVDLRHKATHSSCPPLEMLRNGANYIHDWLLNNYWNPMCDRVQLPYRIPKSEVELDCSRNEYLIQEYKRVQCDKIHSSVMHVKRIQNLLNSYINLIENRLLKKNSMFLETLVKADMFFISVSDLANVIPNDDIDYLVNDESLTLPQSLVNFWASLIAAINRTHSMQAFVHQLLTKYNVLPKLQQKIACGWVFKIVNLAATNGTSEVPTDPLRIAFDKEGWILNWLECTTDCTFNPSIYTSPIFQETIEHVHPPFPKEKKLRLSTMFSVFIGIIPPEFENFSRKKNRAIMPYTSEQLRENLDLREIAGRNPNIDVSKVKWRRAPRDINWSELPLGHVFGSLDNFIGNPPTKEEAEENMDSLTNTDSNLTIKIDSILNSNYEMEDDSEDENFDIQISEQENITVTLDDFY